MRVRESWVRTKEQLARNNIADASLEAEVLLRHATSKDRAEFFAALNEQLPHTCQQRVNQDVRRRLSGEPLAYILGHREFYGLDLCVSPAVLIPRQETELLVDKIIEFSRQRPEQHLLIADVGTGSGAIAVAVAHCLSNATVYATDSSREALLVADVNRHRHAVSERVHLCHGDLLAPIDSPVDVVVSNPPYLTTKEIDDCPQDIRREPSLALDGGADGLAIVKRLFRQAPSYIRPGGLLVVEIAPSQVESVLAMGRDAFPTARVSFSRDLLGLPRAVTVELALAGTVGPSRGAGAFP